MSVSKSETPVHASYSIQDFQKMTVVAAPNLDHEIPAPSHAHDEDGLLDLGDTGGDDAGRFRHREEHEGEHADPNALWVDPSGDGDNVVGEEAANSRSYRCLRQVDLVGKARV